MLRLKDGKSLESSLRSAWPDLYLHSKCQLTPLETHLKTCLPPGPLAENEAQKQPKNPDWSLHDECRCLSNCYDVANGGNRCWKSESKPIRRLDGGDQDHQKSSTDRTPRLLPNSSLASQ